MAKKVIKCEASKVKLEARDIKREEARERKDDRTRKVRGLKKKKKRVYAPPEQVDSIKRAIIDDDVGDEEEEEVDVTDMLVDDEICQNREEEESSDEEPEQEEEDEIRKNMANIPMSQLKEMKEKLGLKLFNKAYFGSKEDEAETSAKKAELLEKKQEKRGQHRPREISSKEKVSTFRNIYPNERIEKKRWDPRFDERAGELKEWCFEKNYEFLDELKATEKEELRKELQVCLENDDERAADIAKALRRMEDQEKSKKEKNLKKEVMQDARQENIDRMMKGQKPIYKTNAQMKMKFMEKKFEQLKKDHKLDKYMQRKAKKDAQKSRKLKPTVVDDFEKKYGYQT